MKKATETPYISVVVPFYNEEESILPLWDVLKSSLDDVERSYEVIFVDDGSSDNTRDIMRELSEAHPELRCILFRANFGQSAAMGAGFEATRGEIVIAMDGDLQNDPRDIKLLVEKLEEGYDVVSGWRKYRQDKLISRKIPSQIANNIICSVTDVTLHDTGCSLKAFRGPLLRRISLYGELHRFIPALMKLEGAKITEIPVRHHARKYGQSKYNISRTFRVIMDLTTIRVLMQHLHNPLGFFAKFSVVCGLVGFITFITFLFHFGLETELAIDRLNILLTLTILLWASAFMFISLGLVGKLIVSHGERKSFSWDF